MTYRVLIVDDEAAIRRALERALGRAGHTVLAAARGDEAWELLRGGTEIDVIFLDLRMPGMSGQTLFQMILAEFPDLARRVVVMSGDPDAEEQASWVAHHGVPVLAKPFGLAQVHAIVEQLMRPGPRRANGHGT